MICINRGFMSKPPRFSSLLLKTIHERTDTDSYTKLIRYNKSAKFYTFSVFLRIYKPFVGHYLAMINTQIPEHIVIYSSLIFFLLRKIFSKLLVYRDVFHYRPLQFTIYTSIHETRRLQEIWQTIHLFCFFQRPKTFNWLPPCDGKSPKLWANRVHIKKSA